MDSRAQRPRIVARGAHLLSSILATALAALAATGAAASYINILDPDADAAAVGAEAAFVPSGTAWDPGPGTARVGGSPSPGGATWSVLPAGLTLDADLADGSGGVVDLGHHFLAQTGDFDLLLDTPGRELEMIEQVLDTWASVSGFSNLGRVTDGGGAIGSPDPSAAVGDIRIGVIELLASDSLAHTFRPSTTQLVPSGGSVGGDMHIDRDRIWIDDPDDTHPRNSLDFDLYTVLLHEMGHALGLGHSSSPEAVMFGSYTGGRRELALDDILGIQSIYGPPPVPEPGTLSCVWGGIVGIALWRRRCAQQR